MTHFIKHIVEPDELLLSWQQERGDRMRRIVGKLTRRGDDASFTYLRNDEDFSVACEAGFSGYPGLSLERDHEGVLPLFVRRLPPRKRTDFGRYVNAFGVEAGATLSDFALLGYSGARLPGDDFTIIHPFTGAEPPLELWLPVAGYRYHQEKVPYDHVVTDKPVLLEPEPENKWDAEAIRVVYNGQPIGYVPRGMTAQFHRWMAIGYSISSVIEKKSGNAERPFVHVYVEIRPKVHGA